MKITEILTNIREQGKQVGPLEKYVHIHNTHPNVDGRKEGDTKKKNKTWKKWDNVKLHHINNTYLIQCVMLDEKVLM
jgi:hypothetical protein